MTQKMLLLISSANENTISHFGYQLQFLDWSVCF